jgi:hypothetical protein
MQELSARHRALSQLYPKAGSVGVTSQMAFPSMMQQQRDAVGSAAATAKSGAGAAGMRASIDSDFLAAGDV